MKLDPTQAATVGLDSSHPDYNSLANGVILRCDGCSKEVAFSRDGIILAQAHASAQGVLLYRTCIPCAEPWVDRAIDGKIQAAGLSESAVDEMNSILKARRDFRRRRMESN